MRNGSAQNGKSRPCGFDVTRPRVLVAIPVFNERKHVEDVLERVLQIHPHVLVIDDGSTDGTAEVLPRFGVEILRHVQNRGYGASMRDAFRYAIAEKYDWLITMDCDEQHEPAAIPAFVEAAARAEGVHHADILSGSRYMRAPGRDEVVPADRRAVNAAMTEEINRRLGPSLGCDLTDSFCGFKAYRVSALRALRPTVVGYAFPMQFWAQAAAARLRVVELPVKLIYNDLNRTFGAALDDASVRLAHYREVLHREIVKQGSRLPRAAVVGLEVGGGEGTMHLDGPKEMRGSTAGCLGPVCADDSGAGYAGA